MKTIDELLQLKDELYHAQKKVDEIKADLEINCNHPIMRVSTTQELKESRFSYFSYFDEMVTVKNYICDICGKVTESRIKYASNN